MYSQERPDQRGQHLRCAICQKNPCACGCEQWEDDAADYDDDGGEWQPAPLPAWAVFFAGAFVGFVLSVLFGK